MTNTLHRYGEAEAFRDDYIVFAIPSRGRNDQGSAEKLRAFLRLAVKYGPVNMGNARYGSLFEPATDLKPTVHWSRKTAKDFDKVIHQVDGPTTVAVVFDNLEVVSKIPQHDFDASESDHTQEIVDVVLVAGNQAAKHLQPSEQTLDCPAPPIAA